MHPVRTAKRAVTPKVVRKASRAIYTVTNPLGAAENALIGAALGPSNRGRGRHTGSRRAAAQPNQGARQQVANPQPTARAIEASLAESRLSELMAAQRERFTPVERPIIAAPEPVDPHPFELDEWKRRRSTVPFWQLGLRRQLRAECTATGRIHAARAYEELQEQQRVLQSRSDAWWHSLLVGDPAVLHPVLTTAFGDNAAPVSVLDARGETAVLAVLLPGIDVLPDKRPHVTPTGKPSVRKWTKSELHEAYADLLGAHTLATIREAWAVAPGLATIRIMGVCRAPGTAQGLLFDVSVTRNDGDWLDDRWGRVILDATPGGLVRVGRACEITSRPTDGLTSDQLRALAAPA
jgi:hypothetical protein